MTSFELVIFDNDGVVVDSELLANTVLATLLSEVGHPTSIEESMRDYMGGTLERVHALVRGRSGLELPPDFDQLYHERLFASYDGLRPIPGIESLLKDLEVPYCLASSGAPERIERSLSATGLLSYFEGRIFSATSVAHGKPAPDLFLHAARMCSVSPSRCAVVEDSASGVTAGRAAGMTVFGFVAMTPPERLSHAHATFDTMEELPVLLGEGIAQG